MLFHASDKLQEDPLFSPTIFRAGTRLNYAQLTEDNQLNTPPIMLSHLIIISNYLELIGPSVGSIIKIDVQTIRPSSTPIITTLSLGNWFTGKSRLEVGTDGNRNILGNFLACNRFAYLRESRKSNA